MKSLSKHVKALILLIITAIFWSLGGILIKSVNAHPLAIAGTRSAIAAVLITIYTRKPKFNWSFAQIAAAIAYVTTVVSFVVANKLTTAANAIFLQYSAPLYVALFGAWLLKEKPRILDWATIGAVIGGMLLFFIDNIDTRGIAGNFFGLLSGVSFGLFSMFMRMQKNGSPIESVILGNIATAVIGIPFLFARVPDTKGWACLVLLGVVQLGISYILYSKAIKHATALEAVLIPVIEPILNPIWVAIFIGETPSAFAIAGGLIVLAAVTIRCVIVAASKPDGKKNEENSSLAS